MDTQIAPETTTKVLPEQTPLPIEHDNVREALHAFQSEVPSIKKENVNPFFKSKYASLPTIWETIQPCLHKHGLTVTQVGVACPEVDSKCVLRTELHHAASRTNLTSDFPLILVKKDAQALGSAITYTRRYALVAILGLQTEDDDDGNAASSLPAQTKGPLKFSD